MGKAHSFIILFLLSCCCLNSFAQEKSIYKTLLATKSGRDTLVSLALLEQKRISGEGKLYSFLKARDPLVRLRAVEVIGRNQLSEGVPHLTDILGDEDQRVVEAAVFALGQLQNPSSALALIKLQAKASVKLQCTIAEALGKIGGKESIDALKNMLQDFYSRLRVSAASALARIAAPQATSALLIAIHDPDPRVIRRVISSLENHHGRRVTNAVIPFLEHGDPIVRSLAARCLSIQKDPTASPILIKLLEDRDNEVVVNSIYALGETREEKAVQPLGRILIEHSSNRIRIAAVQALLKIGGEGAKDRLIKACSDKSIGVRSEAIKAIANMMREKAEMYIAMMLEDGSEVVRAAARESMLIAGIKRVSEASTLKPDSSSWKNQLNPATTSSPYLPEGKREIALKTQHGDILIELFGDDAIQTVGKLLSFNNGTPGMIEKIIPHSMIMASLTEKGVGNDRLLLQPEINRHECKGGYLGISNDAEQENLTFFITYSHLPKLDGHVTIFGRVRKGMDVVNKMDYGETFELLKSISGKKGR